MCHRDGIRIVRTTGLLWRHGPRSNPCTGGNNAPLPGSHRPVTQTGTQPPLDPTSSAELDDTSADLFDSFHSLPPPAAPSIGHPPRASQILKRIPKGARLDASRVLTGLIRDVVRDTGCGDVWVRLFGFAPCCLARPGRGGKSRNLTTLVIRQIQAYDSRVDTNSRPDRCGLPHRVRRGRGKDEDEEVAGRASAKLEEGDIRGAIRILSSKDTIAPMDDSTLASLVALHPPAPIDRRTPPPRGMPRRSSVRPLT